MDEYIEMYAKAFNTNPVQADRVMEAWDIERIDDQYAYYAWEFVVVGGEPYLGLLDTISEQ